MDFGYVLAMHNKSRVSASITNNVHRNPFRHASIRAVTIASDCVDVEMWCIGVVLATFVKWRS